MNKQELKLANEIYKTNGLIEALESLLCKKFSGESEQECGWKDSAYEWGVNDCIQFIQQLDESMPNNYNATQKPFLLSSSTLIKGEAIELDDLWIKLGKPMRCSKCGKTVSVAELEKQAEQQGKNIEYVCPCSKTIAINK